MITFKVCYWFISELAINEKTTKQAGQGKETEERNPQTARFPTQVWIFKQRIGARSSVVSRLYVNGARLSPAKSVSTRPRENNLETIGIKCI